MRTDGSRTFRKFFILIDNYLNVETFIKAKKVVTLLHCLYFTDVSLIKPALISPTVKVLARPKN